jgi:V8-like Glu-specific endopeptidase
MKKTFLTLLLVMIMVVPAFASSMFIDSYEAFQVPLVYTPLDNKTLVFIQLSSTIDKMRSTSVSLLMTSDKNTGICSGTVIKNTDEESIVLTAKHCMPDKPAWIKIFYNNKWYGETIYAESSASVDYISSKDDDLALLFFNEKIEGKTSVKIAETPLNAHELAKHIGYPEMSEYIASGYIIRKTHKDYYIEMTAIGGCSGGGMYNIDGELIGVLYAGITWTMKTTTLFNGLEDINRFLAEAGVDL